MKRFSLWQVGAVAGILALAAPIASLADEYDKKTVVTISQPTEAPGIVLEPGTYVIKLLNSSSNRHIAEIMNERMDHLYALTFTAAAERIQPAGKTILTFYEATNGRAPALKTWFWPGDTIGQEFIYPKNQAQKISAATHQRVPEGNLPTVAESGQKQIPDNINGLSESSEAKQPSRPLEARAAEPQVSEQAAPPPAVVAQNTPPPQPQQVQPQEPPAPRQTEPAPSSTPQQPEQLPQTASPLPLIGLMGLVAIGLGTSIGFARKSRSARG